MKLSQPWNRDPRLVASEEQQDFIAQAIEAGWTFPHIRAELPELQWQTVFLLAKDFRTDRRDALKVCEHCRRKMDSYTASKAPA